MSASHAGDAVDTRLLRVFGEWDGLDARLRALLLERTNEASESGRAVRDSVTALLDRVRTSGDAALREMASEFDGVRLDELEVPRTKWMRALESIEPRVRDAMERAARNIESVHRAFLPASVSVESEPGVRIERCPQPLARVGVYAPGGRAAYPSSVLMGVIPARVAGVREVIVCSPPAGGHESPSPVVLAAAALAGADRVFAVGGAGAIGAMAFGTRSVPRVDRIVGPGNAYVAEAKSQVAGVVGIDSPAGPSELLVVCDESADVTLVAREMLAQAEHDARAVVTTVTVSERHARDIVASLTVQLESQPRAEIAREALAGCGGVVWVNDRAKLIQLANDFAPEHLLLLVSDESSFLGDLRTAGTIFVGSASSVAFGDYMTGANHVLPTGGASRFYSGLSTGDFMRWTTRQYVTPRAAASLAGDTGAFADAEGLGGHALAARSWLARASKARE